jgi:hypothetical protein
MRGLSLLVPEFTGRPWEPVTPVDEEPLSMPAIAALAATTRPLST